MNRQHKYSAKPTEVDGIKFASKLEAKRYGQLKLLEHAGEIRGLRVHPVYELFGARGPLVYESGRAATYEGDFEYVDNRDGCVRIEDTKGVTRGAPYNVFKIKQALMQQRGLTVTVVKR